MSDSECRRGENLPSLCRQQRSRIKSRMTWERAGDEDLKKVVECVDVACHPRLGGTTRQRGGATGTHLQPFIEWISIITKGPRNEAGDLLNRVQDDVREMTDYP